MGDAGDDDQHERRSVQAAIKKPGIRHQTLDIRHQRIMAWPIDPGRNCMMAISETRHIFPVMRWGGALHNDFRQ